MFACNRSASAAVVHAVRRATAPGTPVLAKLSPDVTDLVDIAEGCVGAGADGLSMINTLLGLVIDTERMRPVLGGVTGGLSGPAIRPVAVRCIWQVHQAMPEVPILGMGGIRTGLDVLEMVLAGASAVSIGTVLFNDPSAPTRIAAELRDGAGRAGRRPPGRPGRVRAPTTRTRPGRPTEEDADVSQPAGIAADRPGSHRSAPAAGGDGRARTAVRRDRPARVAADALGPARRRRPASRSSP